MIRNVFILLSILEISAGSAALAGKAPPPPPPPAPTPATLSSNNTTAFVGLNWTFGNGTQTAEAVLGVAYGKSSATGSITGAKGTLHFGLDNGIYLRKLKLTGLAGNGNVQGEVGIGVNVQTGILLGTIGMNGDHLGLGADFPIAGGIEGYVGVHSIGNIEGTPNTVAAGGTAK